MRWDIRIPVLPVIKPGPGGAPPAAGCSMPPPGPWAAEGGVLSFNEAPPPKTSRGRSFLGNGKEQGGAVGQAGGHLEVLPQEAGVDAHLIGAVGAEEADGVVLHLEGDLQAGFVQFSGRQRRSR